MTKIAIAMPYQREGVRLIERKFKGRALLADDMGLGKTLQALWFLKRNPATRPALVVCEANVKYKWELEAKVHCGFTVQVLEGQRAPAHPRRLVRPHVIICNYDILIHWAEYLAQCGIQSLIVDECQNISNLEAQRTQVVHTLARGVPNVLGLSGTPLMNRPIELFSILNLINPKVFRGLAEFGFAYSRPQLIRGKYHWRGARNLPQLHTLLKDTCMVRRLREEVLPDLPPIIRGVVPMPLSNQREYERAFTDFRTWIKETKPSKAKKALKAESVTKVNYLLELIAKLKLPAIRLWIDDWLAQCEDKMIVFGHHQGMVNALHKRYPGSVLVDGGTTARQKQLAVDTFQHSHKCRLMIGSLSATKGITATAGNTVAFTEIWWRPTDHTQGEARVNRYTQTKTTWSNFLIAHGTIEEDLCDVVQDKQDVVSDTLDGKGQGASLPIFDLLMARLAKKGIIV